MSHEQHPEPGERSDRTMVTTADEVVSTFKVTPAARRKYDRWCVDESRARVVELVGNHATVELYRLTLDDVRQVCNKTSHALVNVSRENAERVPAARDWYPRFAFTHLMHYYLEQRKELPTWQKISEFFFHSDEGMDLIGGDTRRLVAQAARDGVSERLVDDALQWRFGNAYYSFLREVFTVVTLRSRGFDVRVHPLADALFRVDGWMGDTVISLWVANEDFRQDKGLEPTGRKERACDLLAEAQPPFSYLNIELDKAAKWGRVHLPSAGKLTRAAATLANPRNQAAPTTAGNDHLT
ncbi:hypothetical protein [Amycolatopsis sp. H20-H5]|uniref:hypothetical protein n=1 Tax=Amycolatopsis sp. H20-H5 TaxID=3046309 RepID=UPI002DB8613D|nr:hypothetical protein [Amycolatopsis sp. H20-H5]MEC3979837.1 hypothetical protein [Amycolatopsis sp. H20-H5]